MYDSATLMKINEWRQAAREGKMTPEMMQEAINVLRQGRTAASQTSTAAKTRKAAAKAPPKSADDLLSELDKL